MRTLQRAILVLVLLAIAAPAVAVDDGPVREPAAPPPAPAVSPERRYNEGLALARSKDWRGAEVAYRDALRARPAFAEAWNGLGYALRNQGKYDDSVRAYGEALRLRPDDIGPVRAALTALDVGSGESKLLIDDPRD